MPSEDSITLLSAISLFETLGLCEISMLVDNYSFSITNNGQIFINKLKLSKYKIHLKENIIAKEELNRKTTQYLSNTPIYNNLCKDKYYDNPLPPPE